MCTRFNWRLKEEGGKEGREKGVATVLKRPTGEIQLSRVDRSRRPFIRISKRLDDNCFRNHRLQSRCGAPENPQPGQIGSCVLSQVEQGTTLLFILLE